VSGLDLGFSVVGPEDAPLLVLSGSLGTTAELWDGQIDALARGFRVVRHDPPGHGASPVPEEPFEISDVGRAILDFVDGLGAGSFSVCGLSMGGHAAMWLVANVPERVNAVVLCCTAARLGTPGGWLERAGLVRWQGIEPAVDRARAVWFTDAFVGASAAEHFFETLRTVPPEGYALCCEAIGRFDFREQLHLVTAPTLVVSGSSDPAVDAAERERLTARLPNVASVVVPAAHLANVEQPDAVTEAILRHVETRAAA
jgi:3-oxoadipate enol-lactonase